MYCLAPQFLFDPQLLTAICCTVCVCSDSPTGPSFFSTSTAELPFSLFSTDTTESAGWDTTAQNTPAEERHTAKLTCIYIYAKLSQHSLHRHTIVNAVSKGPSTYQYNRQKRSPPAAQVWSTHCGVLVLCACTASPRFARNRQTSSWCRGSASATRDKHLYRTCTDDHINNQYFSTQPRPSEGPPG